MPSTGPHRPAVFALSRRRRQSSSPRGQAAVRRSSTKGGRRGDQIVSELAGREPSKRIEGSTEWQMENRTTQRRPSVIHGVHTAALGCLVRRSGHGHPLTLRRRDNRFGLVFQPVWLPCLLASPRRPVTLAQLHPAAEHRQVFSRTSGRRENNFRKVCRLSSRRPSLAGGVTREPTTSCAYPSPDPSVNGEQGA